MLGLQGDVREHAHALEAAGATAVVVRRAEQLDDVDALVIPGGESTTIGLLLDRYGLLGPLRERVAGGLALFGTCAGLILMARTLRGPHDAPHRLGVLDVAVRRNAYGRQVDSFETELAVTGLDRPLRAAFIRAPLIEEVGPEVEVLARHEGVPVLVRQGRLMAASFHPELTGDERIHAMFIAGI